MSQISRDDDEVLIRAKLGVEAESFEHSALGRFLEERAAMEREKLTEDLIKAVAKDPTDSAKLRQINNDIQVIDLFHNFLDEIKQSGRAAEMILEEQDALADEQY